MVVEVDVEPLATGSSCFFDSDRYELSSDSPPADAPSHDRVQDESVEAAVPQHVDEADELTTVPGADPSEAEPVHIALPVVLEDAMAESLSVERV